MNTNAIAQNPAYYEQLTPDNCAMLLIDHQAGLFLGVKSIDQQILKNNAIALAKTAKVFNLPTVLFTSSAKGQSALPIRRCSATSDCQRQSDQLFPKSKNFSPTIKFTTDRPSISGTTPNAAKR